MLASKSFILWMIPILGQVLCEEWMEQNRTSSESNIVHKFHHIPMLPSQTLRVTAELLSNPTNLYKPVLFIAYYQDRALSWQLPDVHNQNSNKLTQTLCSDDELMQGNKSAMLDIIVVQNSGNVSYSIKVEKVQLYVDLDKEHSPIHVSPNAPARFRLKLNEHGEYLVTARNMSQPVCSSVSVLPGENCVDSILSRRYSMYQSMLQQAAITVSADQFPDHHYVDIVIAIKSSNEGCSKNVEDMVLRDMTVSLLVTEKKEDKLWISVGVVLVFYVIVGIMMCSVYFCRPREFRPYGSFKIYEVEPNLFIKRVSKRISTRMNQRTETCQQSTNGNTVTSVRSQSRKDHVTVLAVNGGGDEGSHRPSSREDGYVEMKTFNQTVEAEVHDTQDHLIRPGEDSVDGPLSRDEEAAGLTMNAGAQSPTDHVDGQVSDEDDASNNELTCCIYYKRTVKTKWAEDEVDATDFLDTTDIAGLKLRRLRTNNCCLADTAINYEQTLRPETKAVRNEMSSSYIWLTGLMGIFYTIPVLQLVLDHQTSYRDTGNQDICYYNFKCKTRFGIFEDFGHIFSNLSYFVSGIVFLVFVKRRKKEYILACSGSSKNRNDEAEDVARKSPENLGIPEQFGIYNALGIALVMEGVLSSCYHICPTARNFQFDTTFMYIIAILLFLKVYQFRHPDITQTSKSTFLVIGIILVLEVLGYFTADKLFWGFFVTMALILVVYYILHIDTSGYITEIFSISQFKKAFLEIWQTFKDLTKASWWWLFKSAVVLVINIVLCVAIILLRKPGVSRYLLMLIVINMALYIVYYVCMKMYLYWRPKNCYKNEKINRLTYVYLSLSFALGLFSLYFFGREKKKSSLSPAESRGLNDECDVGMYDSHDLWHFLSAGAILCKFMFILTLEDNNMGQQRKRIRVF